MCVRDDIGGAKGVGMRAVLTREFRSEEPDDVRPDAVIDRLSELRAALAQLASAGYERPG